MQSSSLKSEISWFVGGLLGAFLAGLILSLPLAVPIVFLCGYTIWLLYRMDAMVNWLRAGAKTAKVPPTLGLTDEMVELIHRE